MLVGMALGPACNAATNTSPPGGIRPLTLPQLVAGIVSHSADLNYITEQDSEVFAFYRNTPVTELTDNVFLELLRRPEETQITAAVMVGVLPDSSTKRHDRTMAPTPEVSGSKSDERSCFSLATR